MGEIKLLLWFGIAVIAGLSFRLIVQPSRNGEVAAVAQLAARLHPLTALCVGAALLLAQGTLSALLACTWLVESGLYALYGLIRLLPRPSAVSEELCIDAALLYAPISGVWLVAACAGYPLLTFDPVFVMLTAVHFAFVTMGALVLAGMVGRRLIGRGRLGTGIWRFYRVLAILLIAGPALIALGITTTRYTSQMSVELLTVIEFAGSLLAFALLILSRGLPMRSEASLLIQVSAASLLVTMSLAIAYVVGRVTGWWLLSIPDMIRWHGWINAVGFALCGLAGWALDTPEPKIAKPGIPFSRLAAQGHVGANFFQRMGIIDNQRANPPMGIVDRMEDYRREEFEPSQLPAEVTDFYELTALHKLLVYPEWQQGFQRLSKIYKRLSRRLEQMNFPLRPDKQEMHVASSILPLNDALDGRRGVRGWVRVYEESGQAVYVAAYANHQYAGETYMNIAFPLPFGNLTSILRLEDHPDCRTGLLLTSFSTRRGDQGVYFANRWIPFRLPMNETIEVFASDDTSGSYKGFPASLPRGSVLARHTLWLFNRHYLTLYYSIARE